MTNPQFNRFRVISGLLIAAGLLIFIWMVSLLTNPQAQKLKDWLMGNISFVKTIEPERGLIYDRYGRLLAGNREAYEVGIDLRYLDPEDAPFVVTTLSNILEIPEEKIKKAIEDRKYNSDDPESPWYVYLKDFVPSEKIEAIKQKKADLRKQYQNASRFTRDSVPSLSSVNYKPRLIRTYPEGALASNIVGFYPYQNVPEYTKPRGVFGIEEFYNDLLAGTPVTVQIENDPYKITEAIPAPKGANLVLTIDREIQAEVEKVLDQAVSKNKAEGGSIIVANPQNGEILAMATSTRMDINQYWKFDEIFSGTDGATFFNRPVSRTYEPGSVFKVITMASAYDLGAVNPDTVYLDSGKIVVGGISVYNWDRIGHGNQTMIGCLQMSLNTCLSWVATQIKPTRFYEYMQRFGIGRHTNIDLAGEANYPVPTIDGKQVLESNLATNSFGQGVAVTPIQMVMAVSALANDGVMMAPHLLKSYSENGKQYYPPPQIAGRPISPEAARKITDSLAKSLEIEASKALIPGYRIAGKTGTAEIPGPYGYLNNATHASFVGWGPVDNPQFVVYIWLEKPKTSPWGSVVAAPIFSDLGKKLVILMDIPPDKVQSQLANQ
jgi:cell division protein FtsI/penicillin-binding protein 2